MHSWPSVNSEWKGLRGGMGWLWGAPGWGTAGGDQGGQIEETGWSRAEGMVGRAWETGWARWTLVSPGRGLELGVLMSTAPQRVGQLWDST